jgi:hypothetical protein
LITQVSLSSLLISWNPVTVWHRTGSGLGNLLNGGDVSRSALRCARVSGPLALVLALFPALAAHAQVVALGIAAGATVPTGSYADANNLGYHAFLTLDAHVRLAPIGFRVDGLFNEMTAKNGGDNPRIWAGTANLVVNTAGTGGPYLIGGVGVYSWKPVSLLGTSSTSQNDFGVNIGAGIRIPLTGFGTFVEVRYHKVMNGSPVQMIPITFGIML